MNKLKSILIWIISFLLMAGMAYYQRISGPTYPIKGNIVINNKIFDYKLPRTHTTAFNGIIKLHIPDNRINAIIKYKRFKSHDTYQTDTLKRLNDTLIAEIPCQPPAGKVIYELSLINNNSIIPLVNEPVIIRFKGDVPTFWLILHIIFIFCSMWFSTLTGLKAYFKSQDTYKYTIITTILLLLGGLCFGPIIQEYAFGMFWTGWPIGHDLTDNKTIIGFIFWVIAFIKLKKNKNNTFWALLASIVLFIVFLIPHSVLGSEIDWTQAPPPIK